MKKRNNIKELLGPQYLQIMQTQAVGEIAEAMADPTNTDNLRRAMLTMSKIQHELTARTRACRVPPRMLSWGGLRGGKAGARACECDQ